MGNPVARVGDRVEGLCNGPGHTPGRPFTGVWVNGSETVTVDGLPVIRIGDTGITDCGHTFQAVSGSGVSGLSNVAIHRVGDQVLTEGGGIGYSVTGSLTTTSE